MQLLFNLRACQPIKNIKFHGGGRYGEIVFKALARKLDSFACYCDPAAYIDPEIRHICESRNFRIYDSARYTLEQVLAQGEFLLYSPIPSSAVFRLPSPHKCITTIHGLRSLELPYDEYMFAYLSAGEWKERFKYFMFKHFTSYMRKRITSRYERFFRNPNAKYITVSDHSKYSLLSFFPMLQAASIRVYYSPETALPAITTPRCRDKYYLLTNGNRWTKNTIRAIKALDTLFSERPEIEGRVIVTGVDRPELLLKRIKNKSRFEMLNYVSYEELAALYRDAYLFIYPTLNEGFGYPPLEAMQYGTPVISSAITSTTEICGDAVPYFNPYFIEEIKNRILMMEDREVREQYVQKGLQRYTHIKARQQKDLESITDFILSQL